MYQQGYFKAPMEYDKASKFLTENNIPEWFKEDMKIYYAMMRQEKLEYSEKLMIGN